MPAGTEPCRTRALWGMILTPEIDQGRESDSDALHVLPLSAVPINTEGLRRARLIKNAALEGVVELFTGEASGSGYIQPRDLKKVYVSKTVETQNDIELIQRLGPLPSYDVYSLRVELRKLGVPIKDTDGLRLSGEKLKQLSEYMYAFTLPLVTQIYGKPANNAKDYDALIALFQDPNVDEAKKNLALLAKKLKIERSEIPKFIQDYGDIYLSLAFYRQCLDRDIGKVTAFLDGLPEIRENRALKENMALVETCDFVEDKIRTIVSQIYGVLDMFKLHTDDMWADISPTRFKAIKDMILSYQSKIGGGLCAVHVKMNIWSEVFTGEDVGGPYRRADFIMTHMKQGLERIEEIQFGDLTV